jgi:hypothetical protein
MDFIALHQARFDLGMGASIDIETVLGNGCSISTDLEISGLVAAEAEIELDTVSSGGIPPMCWRESGHLFERFQLREDTDYFVDIHLPIHLDEASKRAKAGPHWPFSLRLANVFKRDPARRWKEIENGGRPGVIVTGQLRLRSHAGVIDLGTEFGNPLIAEIACRKLKYFEEFKELLDSLAEKAAELLLSFDSPVSLSFDVSKDLAKNESALHFLMRHIMSKGNLPLASEEILANPHSSVIENLEFSRIEEIESADADLISDGFDASEMFRGGPLARLFRGFTPTALPQRESFETFDTPENRYAKAFLEHCTIIARRLESSMGKRKRKASEREARSWADTLEDCLSQGLWQSVSHLGQIPTNSQALIHRRGYKELFRLDLSLRMSLSLAWQEAGEIAEGLIGDIRPVDKIYEYWCYFVLRDALTSICTIAKGGNFISVSKDGLRIELTKGKRSECRFEFINGVGKRVNISLFYNKQFRRPRTPKTDWDGSYTSRFDPDFSLLVSQPSNSAVKHWLHFDAKYRLEREEAEGLFDEPEGEDMPASEIGAEDPSISEYEAELVRIFKQDDLYKMHTYRDAILGTRGAYVLFPGDSVGGRLTGPSPNLFVRHPSAFGGSSAHRIPSVGVFDLAPNGAPAQVSAILDLMRTVFEIAATGVPYQEEQENFS